MKTFILFILTSLISAGVTATDWVAIDNGQQTEPEITLAAAGPDQSTVQFTLTGFDRTLVDTDRGQAWSLHLEGGGVLLHKGDPQLPLMAASLIIPDQAGSSITVVTAEYTEFQDVLIAPSKGNLTRDIDPASIPWTFGEAYDEDKFYPGELAELGEPYIVRDFRGQAVRLLPFQYNPVQKVLRVYHKVTVRIDAVGQSAINTIDRQGPPETISRPFRQVYSRHFLNYGKNGLRYDPVEEEGNMIVISYGDFMDEVEPLVEWKKMKGISCSLVDVATIGTTSTEIKQFIKTAYNFGDVTYVLLVGDSEQVPASQVNGNDSDVDYSYVEGNDHYPDLFVGRFSAQNESQVTTQVSRTLSYEQDPVSDTAWYRKAIGIASSQGPGDDNEMDYQHIRNIQDNKLIPYTYNFGYEFFDGSQGGNDNPGNPTPSMVSTCVNSGATIINYTGHGSTSAWSTSGFSSSDVNNLTNDAYWPFIISVACVNGNFVNSTCFAEAWLRAEDGGDPTGAIATLMSTINQSWNPPMHGQDEMNDILTEAFTDNIKHSFGGITMNGCMGMNDVYGSQGYEMTDTWTIFGDPSVVVRTDIPADMSVSHPDTLELEETTVTITCDAEGGLAVLSLDGAILGKAPVEEGEAVISFPPLTDAGTADVVVTAYNYRPYISTLEIVGVIGPMVVYADSEVNDENGNDDGLVDYAEEIMLTVALENIGSEDAMQVTAQLSTSSPWLEISIPDTLYGDILSGETVSVTDGFCFTVADDVPDGEMLEFSISAQDESGRGSWVSQFSLTAHAPVLGSLDFTIEDEDGNDNGRLDAGETAKMIFEITNSGSSAAYNLMGQLTSESEYISILTDELYIGDIQGGGDVKQAVFQVTAAGDTPLGHLADLGLQVVADHNISYEDSFMAIVGRKAALILDLAGTGNTADTLFQCMDQLSIIPDNTTQIPEYPDMYQSIFVLLGVYPDNHVLTAEEAAALALFLEQGGRIYMEGGDTWFSDEPTELHPMFHIQGLEDGSDDASMLMGEKETFLEGFEFQYSGANNFIDRISPVDDAVLLMSNADPVYGVAVSFENGIYRTVGSSVLMGGFTDQPGSSKDEMVAEILDFFEVGYTWTGVDQTAANGPAVKVYPNPAKERVQIELFLNSAARVRLDIFDLTGRRVEVLADRQLAQGSHRFTWDAKAGNARPGIYFYHLEAGQQSHTGKLILD